jgi:hypothetical protein
MNYLKMCSLLRIIWQKRRNRKKSKSETIFLSVTTTTWHFNFCYFLGKFFNWDLTNCCLFCLERCFFFFFYFRRRFLTAIDAVWSSVVTAEEPSSATGGSSRPGTASLGILQVTIQFYKSTLVIYNCKHFLVLKWNFQLAE